MQSEFLFKQPSNLLPYDGEVLLLPDFLNTTTADNFQRSLESEINWQQEAITLFGKKILQPRLTALYGNSDKPYSYSGITMHPNSWTPTLLQIKNRIENYTNEQFTTVLLNLYRHGRDSMGWHRDNEKTLGINPTIASVSLGASRKFMLRHYHKKHIKQTITLTHGSLLLMRGETQHYWEHQIPKNKHLTDVRINLTFRRIL